MKESPSEVMAYELLDKKVRLFDILEFLLIPSYRSSQKDPFGNIFHDEYQHSEDSESDEDLGIEEHYNSRNCEREDP